MFIVPLSENKYVTIKAYLSLQLLLRYLRICLKTALYIDSETIAYTEKKII